jgi:hypothetical protein
VALNVSVASGLDSKSLEALQKAVFEIGGGDPELKADMSQYHMQLHVCGDSHMWGSVGAGAGPASSAAAFVSAVPSSAAAAAAVRPCTAVVGSDEAVAAAATHVQHTAAAATTVQQHLVLYGLVLSLQTVKALRLEVE